MYESDFRSFKGLWNSVVSRSSNTNTGKFYAQYVRYNMSRRSCTRNCISTNNTANDIFNSRHYRRMDLW